MRKEELRKLKRINATPKMVQMARYNKEQIVYKSRWGNKKKNTKYDMFVRTQTRGKYLMVCLFFPEKIAAGELMPTYEIYCNPEGDEYITRYLEAGEEKGWRTAMADNLDEVGYYWIGYWERENYPGIEKRIWQNTEGKKTIQQFLKTKKTGIDGLVEWQRKVKDRKIQEAEAREKAPWDADMKLVPKIMPSFKNWMKKNAASQYFIIYEYKNGKVPDMGWCSGCQRFVPIMKPRHNKKGKCKKCGKNITFKAAGKIKTLSVGWYRGQCIQKIDGGIVAREFEQYQWYRDADYTKPKSVMRENERILILDDGTVKRYFYGLYKNKEHRFILDKNYRPTGTYYSYYTTKLYPRNLNGLKKTVLKNSAVDLWDPLPMSVTKYLAIEQGNPAVEKLAKIGMFRLALEIMRIEYDRKLLQQDQTELAKLLKIDNARLKRLRAIDGGITALKWYQYEKRVNCIWPDEMIKDFEDNKISSSSFGFLSHPHSSYVKLWHYLLKQRELCGEPLFQIMRTWDDYICMAEKAKMDIKNERIWKPKDLKAAHNEVVLILQKGEMEKEAKKLEKKWPKVNGNLEKLKKFEYTDGKFAIVAPENILDIVKEGRILQHCVHTCDFYFDRIQKDETYLFFLRRAEHKDVPWYTLEVEAGGNIRQKRTTGDNQNEDFEEAVPFLKKWQKEFIKRLTKAERELGEKADQARVREYQKLRKDGNKVWHGKLAGKLLADVLEEDFMAAAT